MDALEILLDDPEMAAAVGKRNRQSFLNLYTLEHSAEAMIVLYRRLARASV